MANFGGASGGNYPPRDLRGQGGGDRDSHKLPNDGLSQAEYAHHMDDEREDVERGRKPRLVERFKRWFSAQF